MLGRASDVQGVLTSLGPQATSTGSTSSQRASDRSLGEARRSSMNWTYRRQVCAPRRGFCLVDARNGFGRLGMKRAQLDFDLSCRTIQPVGPSPNLSPTCTTRSHCRKQDKVSRHR